LFQHGFDDVIHLDALHATKVDGAFTQKTRAAFDGVTNHSAAGGERPGKFRRSRSPDADHGRANRSGDVHRARIVRQKQLAKPKQRAQIQQRGLAGNVDNGALTQIRITKLPFDLVSNIDVLRAAKDEPTGIGVMCDLDRGFGEAFGRPAFRRAEFRARVDGDDGSTVIRRNLLSGGSLQRQGRFAVGWVRGCREVGDNVKVLFRLMPHGPKDFYLKRFAATVFVL